MRNPPTHMDILWVHIIAVGPIVKINLAKQLLLHLGNMTSIEAAVLVLGIHRIAVLQLRQATSCVLKTWGECA